ncbi:PREDICTED: A-agglutinin anchorage subunit-like [Rhagoletis zephyria]|uniref:A-agglutinin anchorage subunit-like n=1 Tax=Rhagoletis zephyria TaxID=28612 RepID=UPI00081183DB|nr:PREDICTED: A-agglutinin anchorage subunit-like [Rhagoletis zephyria]
MWKTSLAILVALLVAPRQVKAECNVCNTNNGVACTTNTTFQLCFNGVPQGTTWSCPNEGEVCTSLGSICADAESNSLIQAACGNTEQCGNCEAVNDGAYSCTSHTTFTMCSAGEATTVQGTCPSDQVCLTSRANEGVSPCVNQCLQDIDDMCDLSSDSTTTTSSVTETSSSTASTDSTTTTSSETVTSSSTASTDSTTTTSSVTETSSSTASTATSSTVENTECASKSLVGRYPYPNDTVCTSYIYCYYSAAAGTLLGQAMTCPTGKYFNSAIRNCQAAKPTDCV